MFHRRHMYQSDNVFLKISKTMAKKESEISVEERLKTLYQLQTTLSSIDEKRALRGELPLEVQDLEDEIAGLKTRVEHIEGDIVASSRLSLRSRAR